MGGGGRVWLATATLDAAEIMNWQRGGGTRGQDLLAADAMCGKGGQGWLRCCPPAWSQANTTRHSVGHTRTCTPAHMHTGTQVPRGPQTLYTVDSTRSDMPTVAAE